jgi:hypothetical protein
MKIGATGRAAGVVAGGLLAGGCAFFGEQGEVESGTWKVSLGCDADRTPEVDGPIESPTGDGNDLAFYAACRGANGSLAAPDKLVAGEAAPPEGVTSFCVYVDYVSGPGETSLSIGETTSEGWTLELGARNVEDAHVGLTPGVPPNDC